MIDDSEAVAAPFEERLAALIGLAQEWVRILGGNNATLSNLLQEFNAFSTDYFKYFKAIANDGEDTYSQALQRIQAEFDNISLACIQRESEKFKQPLTLTDDRAETYYSRFTGRKPQATPITYFGKYHAITRYPFTPYAIVSLPVEVREQDGEWWALAHELGHHIYWNSADIDTYRQLQQTLHDTVITKLYRHLFVMYVVRADDPATYMQAKSFVTLVDLWTGWLEETFADICGTLMAGVGYVESAIARAKSARDGLKIYPEHPIPYLRPLIGLETLRWVQKNLAPSNTDLGKKIVDLDDEIKAYTADVELGIILAGQNLELLPLKNSFQPVVQAMLESRGWGGYSSTADEPLGKLFKIDGWLNELPDIEFKTYSASSVLPELKDTNESFAKLLAHLKKAVEKAGSSDEDFDNRLKKTLLDLDLGEDKHMNEIVVTLPGGLIITHIAVP